MKIGTHNLGSNAFSNITVVKIDGSGMVLRQTAPAGEQKITLSANQIALLKDVLA